MDLGEFCRELQAGDQPTDTEQRQMLRVLAEHLQRKNAGNDARYTVLASALPDTPMGRMVLNILEKDGIYTLGHLTEYEPDELLDLRNFGTGCLALVTETLTTHGLALKPNRRTTP